MKRGYVQVYTGAGKGKTTAALGLIVRAVGAGLRVYLGQFIKKGRFSEIRSLERRFPDVTVEQYGAGCFIRGRPTPDARRAARAGLAKLRKAVLSGRYDVVIADEVCCAVKLGLVRCSSLVNLAKSRPAGVELVFTGRDAPRALLECADLATEMRPIKHYWDKGVRARRGIEM